MNMLPPFSGIHPWFLNPAEWKEEMPRLESLLQKIPPWRALGKRGWTNAGRGIPGLPLQKEALERHLELAARLDRPASLPLHAAAWGTLAEMLKKYPRLNIVLHGWTGASIPARNFLRETGFFP